MDAIVKYTTTQHSTSSNNFDDIDMSDVSECIDVLIQYIVKEGEKKWPRRTDMSMLSPKLSILEEYEVSLRKREKERRVRESNERIEEKLNSLAKKYARNRVKMIKAQGLHKTGRKPTLYLKSDGLYRKVKGAYAKSRYDLASRPMRRNILVALSFAEDGWLSGKALKAKVGSKSLRSVYQDVLAIRQEAPSALQLSEDLIVQGKNKGYRLNYRIEAVDKS